MFVSGEGLFYNLQSGTYFTTKVEPQGETYNLEAATKVGPGNWLRKILGLDLTFTKKTFIDESTVVSPKYIEKLTQLEKMGLAKFKLFEDRTRCINFTRQNLIRITIDIQEKRLQSFEKTLKLKEGNSRYDAYEVIYGTHIDKLNRLIEVETQKLSDAGVERVLKGKKTNKQRKSKKAKKKKKKQKANKGNYLYYFLSIIL